MGRKSLILIVLVVTLFSCKHNDEKNKLPAIQDLAEATPIEEITEFGYKLNDYIVVRDTIKSGDSFSKILDYHKVDYSTVYNIVENVRDIFDIRNLRAGKPYTLLCAKDSLQTPQVFIYQPNKIDYVVLDFSDKIKAYKSKKPIKYVEREVTGIIKSNISEALEEKGVSIVLANKMSDIYAWTIDFFRLQENDRFKVIYTEKYINDSIYAGIETIKAAYFEHKDQPFYAFEFVTDTTKGFVDYYDEKAKTLRRAFLTAPLIYKNVRISSRYNLRRRIALYGNRIRPHKGTDFAAPVGTPIVATANGTVVKSSYTGGNGNYVKIKHNSTYSTQYLHMKKRNVKVGNFVKQGDVIGWVGMTGYTSGPHVCYRFWKHGRQVDPFREKLPEPDPISDSLKVKYLQYMKPFKTRLDAIQFGDEASSSFYESLSLVE